MSNTPKPYYETKSFKAASIGVKIVSAPFYYAAKAKQIVTPNSK